MSEYTAEAIGAVDARYGVERFVDAPASGGNVACIELDSIDLSLFKEGPQHLSARKSLARQLEKSITTYGFFNIVNYGVGEAEVERLRSVAQSLLKLPVEVQKQYLAGAERKELEPEDAIGGERAQGFKPKGYWVIKDGVRDSITHYNFKNPHLPQFVRNSDLHHELVRAHVEEIASFYRTIHLEVLPKLLSLCDLIFEVPEGTTYRTYFEHSQDDNDSSLGHGRFMLYEPYSDIEKSKISSGTWLRGHSDISAFSFITSQPMLSLQIQDFFDGEWKYVKHKQGSLVVNIGDAMEFISGGLFKASLHRVHEPPHDQKSFERLVLIYFCNPTNDASMDPDKLNSPKLKNLGLSLQKDLSSWEQISFAQWNHVKGKTLGRSQAQERNLIKLFGRPIERWHHQQLI